MAIQTYQQKSVNLESHGSRDPYFDVVKLFAIVLVVYGHVSGAFGCMFGYPWIRNFIIGMNMPLFFIISGYFLGKTIKDGNWRKFGKHILSYAWPTVVVSVVFAVLAVAFHIKGGEVGVVGYAGRRFLFSPWFLWCLAVCYAVTFFCFRLKLPVLRGGGGFIINYRIPVSKGRMVCGGSAGYVAFFPLGGIYVAET